MFQKERLLSFSLVFLKWRLQRLRMSFQPCVYMNITSRCLRHSMYSYIFTVGSLRASSYFQGCVHKAAFTQHLLIIVNGSHSLVIDSISSALLHIESFESVFFLYYGAGLARFL